MVVTSLGEVGLRGSHRYRGFPLLWMQKLEGVLGMKPTSPSRDDILRHPELPGEDLDVIEQGDTIKFRRKETDLMGSGEHIIIHEDYVVKLSERV